MIFMKHTLTKIGKNRQRHRGLVCRAFENTFRIFFAMCNYGTLVPFRFARGFLLSFLKASISEVGKTAVYI